MKTEDIKTKSSTETEEDVNVSAEQTADAEDQKQESETTATDGTPTEEETPVDPLTAAQAEIEELKKQALYKQAEFENYRKRTLKEKADLILGGAEKFIKEILPVLDDFDRALADKSEDPKVIKEGEQLIYNKFQKILEGMGVKKIDTTDADFNTDFHESIALVPGMGEDKKGKVIDCVQTGYMLNDKVIRYAKVAVGQ